MALGANISAYRREGSWSKILKLLAFKHDKLSNPGRQGRILYKAGIPVSNTAADDPTRANVFIHDTTNDKVYWVSAYTNSTTFTVLGPLNP